MKILRWIGCRLNLRHRLIERWFPLATCGMSSFSATNYGCQIRGPKGEEEVQYFKCLDCDAVLAPFEVGKRGWSYTREENHAA